LSLLDFFSNLPNQETFTDPPARSGGSAISRHSVNRKGYTPAALDSRPGQTDETPPPSHSLYGWKSRLSFQLILGIAKPSERGEGTLWPQKHLKKKTLRNKS
jgi:hypothetical protein